MNPISAMDVEPLWYQSTAFFVVASCGIVFICFLVGIFTSRHLKLEHLIEEHTSALRDAYDKNVQYETEMKAIASELCSSEERVQRRIGQDLHDDLVQRLTGIGMLMQSMQKRIESRIPDESVELGRLINMLSTSVSMTRDLAKMLAPLSLESHGLHNALKELALEIQGMYHIQCIVACDSDLNLSNKETLNHLFRIAQEALVNAGRHSKAASVWLTVRRLEDGVLLTVRDNGIGMPDNVEEKQGLGLRSIRYRCSLINGQFEMKTEPGHGVEIQCRVSEHSLHSL
ncbi:sensor histidine kinase [bacterium]|nr:sensor histidine kinase [bacterium]